MFFSLYQNEVPKLNLKNSVLSEELFVIGLAKEKLNGPIGESKLIAIPVALLILFSFLSIVLS